MAVIKAVSSKAGIGHAIDYICITDVQKSIDKISGQAKQGQYII